MNQKLDITNPYEIARYIKESKKVTPVKAYVNGDLKDADMSGIRAYGADNFWILFGDHSDMEKFLSDNKSLIRSFELEYDRRNSAIPLLDTRYVDARIEPGAVIRDKVLIHKNAVIMMGAVINIGAEVGENTMIDMNAVLGARAVIGSNCHIGAGSVIAGVLEPPSADPVIIKDNVLIGANAVVLEGVRIGKGAVVAAGSVVTKNVEPDTVVAGIPARMIKSVKDLNEDKKKLLDDLRG